MNDVLLGPGTPATGGDVGRGVGHAPVLRENEEVSRPAAERQHQLRHPLLWQEGLQRETYGE